MTFLSYLGGVAIVRELTGEAHIAGPMQQLYQLLEKGYLAIVDIGAERSLDGASYRAIFLNGSCVLNRISFRDVKTAAVNQKGIRVQGGPVNFLDPGPMPPIILGSTELSSDSSDIAHNFARPCQLRLEVKCATSGHGTFKVLAAIEYKGRVLRCRSSAVSIQLTGRRQFVEVEIPEVLTDDQETTSFLESASFVDLCTVFFALATEIDKDRYTLRSNWVFGFLPAHYVS